MNVETKSQMYSNEKMKVGITTTKNHKPSRRALHKVFQAPRRKAMQPSESKTGSGIYMEEEENKKKQAPEGFLKILQKPRCPCPSRTPFINENFSGRGKRT